MIPRIQSCPRRHGLRIAATAFAIALISGCAQMGSRFDPQASAPVLADTAAPPPQADIQPPSFAESPVPEPADDLLSRLAREFRWSIQADTPQVERWIRYYLDEPDEFTSVLNRAEPYLHHISTRIRNRQLPMELALLPFVESGFNPRARSGSGAAGLWQFMPSTGRSLGLEQSWWVDERYSVEPATESALDYLEYLYARFDSDWLLALAAYNTGEGNVSRELRQSHTNADFWSLHLNTETRNYVPRLLAVVHLIKESKRYALTLPQWEDQPFYTRLTVSQQLDMRKLENLSSNLFALNAQYVQQVTFPREGTELLVPRHDLTRLSSELESNAEEIMAEYGRYQVRNGDNLSLIADRHGVSLAALMSVNNLRNHIIHPGDDLLIPLSVANTARATPATESREGLLRIRVRSGDSLSLIAERYRMRLRDLLTLNELNGNDPIFPNQELLVRTPIASGDPLVYQVANGDSLSQIANRFNVGLDDLLTWNGLNGREVIYPGQELSIWVN